MGMSSIMTPVYSSRYLKRVGESWPSSSSFRMVSWMEWKSKWVVIMFPSALSAGC